MRLGLAGGIILCMVGAALAQDTKPDPTPSGAWLDVRPLLDWNVPGAPIARAPRRNVDDMARCKSEILNATPAQRQVTAAGWTVTQEKQLGAYSLLLGMTGVDGMCRPMGFEVFVFVDGRFVGTVSPVIMDSRVDGMAGFWDAKPAGRDLVIDFYRYKPDDALCCPSGLRRVTFKLVQDPRGTVLRPTSVHAETPK